MAALAANGEIKPYNIHVSSRYLHLTRQKLEITRLPREASDPKPADCWDPKAQVDSLIDFWLEEYDWREQEDLLNQELPQFRTSFSVAPSDAPVRTHFIHFPSPHANAVPLLLIPPFPFSNLSFGHLIKGLTDPSNAAEEQPFHLVIPSLPGLGFSDALPSDAAPIAATAELFNSLMDRLSYPCYIVSNVSPAIASPGEIDFQVASHLARNFPDSCVGAHFISPPIPKPKFQEAPLEWARCSVAGFFRTSMLGYEGDDFAALGRLGRVRSKRRPATSPRPGLGELLLRDPNTLAYALCDSPTGLLIFVLRMLQLLGPRQTFTSTELLNFTQLAWLPGPEASLRMWSRCAQNPEQPLKGPQPRPTIGLTVFLGEEVAPPCTEDSPPSAGDGQKIPYTCPSWARVKYNVLYAQRASGEPGLLAWERPEILFTGIRGLASVLVQSSRLKPAAAPTALEQVVVAADANVHGVSAKPLGLTDQAREHPQREISGDTAVETNDTTSTKRPSSAPANSSRTYWPALWSPPAIERPQPQLVRSDSKVVARAAGETTPLLRANHGNSHLATQPIQSMDVVASQA